jgi:hypothetical protein
MIELEHSPLGGSGANRFMACLGSFLKHREQLVAGTFENIESDFAKLGTAAHEVAAVCLQQHKEPYEFIGWTCGPYTVAVPSDASEPNTIDPNALAVYVNECERIYPRDGKGTVAIETTFHRENIHPLLKGTVDFGYWSPKRGMHIRDYKNGEGIGVRAPNNKQLLYYGYVMAESYAWLGEGPKDLPVTLGIVQPNFYGVFEAPDVWETKLGTVLEWGRDELVPYMHKATQREHIDETDFVPGDHCQFCPVMLECPKAQAAYKALVGGASEIITLADGTDTIAMLSNEELDQYFGQRALARKFMNVLETTVKARALTGTKFEHAKIVEKQTHRVWKPGAQAALEAKFGVHAYTPKKIKSPAAIEKLSSDGKAMALEYGFKPDANGYSVAGMEDRRPAAIPTSSNEKIFAGFEMKPPEFDL